MVIFKIQIKNENQVKKVICNYEKSNPKIQFMKKLLTLFLLFSGIITEAQVKIGNNPATIDPNSLLELESTNKGFLPPRVALNSISSVSPLTGTVPAGMLVFSSGGTLTDGYYYWNGTEWKRLENGQQNMVTKTANATLTKTETFVLASNEITLTLPVVTSADNGLEITVKHMGTYTDLVTVQGNGGATIDAGTSFHLHRWDGMTFVVNGANWIIKRKENIPDDIMDVNPEGNWTTIQEAIEYLNVSGHMTEPVLIRLGALTYDVPSTIEINLPYSLTFQGISYGTTTIAAASGLTGKPMFRCLTESYFKMLQFDATTLSGYGTAADEDAIRLLGSGTYNEIKDCSFDRFYNTILDSTNAELWLFETDISNAQSNGILIHGNDAGVTVKVAETDFISCNVGVNLSKATNATIQLASGGYYNSGGTAILYQPSTFTSFANISITGNSWNNSGTYISGFDFTRSDGRDANAILESNAGMGDKKPNCYVNVTNNATATTLTSNATWYKASWTTTSSITCKWTIGNNRITYQPANRRDGYITISGNIQSSNSSAVVNIGLVKNGVSGTRYGETTLRPGVANQPVQFSTVIYLSDIGPTDYFELWCNSGTNSITVTFQDAEWLVHTQ